MESKTETVNTAALQEENVTLRAQLEKALEHNERLKLEVKERTRWKAFGGEVPEELEEDVKFRMAAGISLPQALEAAKLQHLQDMNAMRRQTREKE
jgi:hypothetical protein